MDTAAFEAMLAREGFSEIVTVVREPGGALDTHTHPFEAKALILDGEISIAAGAEERCYRTGDIFHLPANAPHVERYGSQGVRYLVGRK